MAKIAENKNVVDLDAEDSIGAAGAVGKVVSVAKRQSAGARRSYDESPKCPHCTGRMHMNLPAATINFECLWRQYNLASGGMESPDERLPAFVAEQVEPFNEWIKTRSRSRKNPLSYGKMDASGGGGPATYSAARAAAVKAEKPTVDAKEAAAKVKAKTGAAAKTIPVEAAAVVTGKAKRAKAEAVVVEEPSPTKRARVKTASTNVETPSVVGKPAKLKKVAPAQDFDIDSMEFEAPAAAPKAKKSNVTQLPVKAAKGAKADGGKRKAALAAVK